MNLTLHGTYDIIVFRIYCTYDKQYFSQHEFYQRASLLIIPVRFLVIVGVSYILCLEPINPLGLSTMVSFKAEQGEPKVRGERGEGRGPSSPSSLSLPSSLPSPRHHNEARLCPEDSWVDQLNPSKIWDWYGVTIPTTQPAGLKPETSPWVETPTLTSELTLALVWQILGRPDWAVLRSTKEC